jgi:hypothetical protein
LEDADRAIRDSTRFIDGHIPSGSDSPDIQRAERGQLLLHLITFLTRATKMPHAGFGSAVDTP